MPASPEKLAPSLERLKRLQDQGQAAIRSRDLPRTHRERLLANGFLQEVMKGWYTPIRPTDRPGDSSPWYAAFWNFCADYYRARFGDQWCLSPEQSISTHVGNRTVPRQLLVRTPRGSNKPTQLLHGTSLFDMRLKLPGDEDIEEKENLRIYKLPMALVEAVPSFFGKNSTDARAALASFQNASSILSKLLEGGHSTIAGRLCGAFRNIGRDDIAGEIKKTMMSAGYSIREVDPFENKPKNELPFQISPYTGRIRIMWQEMRQAVIDCFPNPKRTGKNADAYLEHIDEEYVTDAYHSLSIEGYRVSPKLIERVRSGKWEPETRKEDRHHADALAARGYFQAFQVVRKSVQSVLAGSNGGDVVKTDHGDWYREMFAPLVAAGVTSASDLAGYRSGQVFISGSRHVPMSGNAVNEVMPVFFELLTSEPRPEVRVVLGHFLFVYIHPYPDGNGRMARFLMNTMLAAGGYPWTSIPVEMRTDYMFALEVASVKQDIVPFAKFLGALVEI